MSEENTLLEILINASLTTQQNLGSGALTLVYEQTLAYELMRRGLHVTRMSTACNYILMLNDVVLVQLLSTEQVDTNDKKSFFDLLQLVDKKSGLLINFGAPYLMCGIHRFVNDN
jgi:GxxExxY protein